VKPLMRWMHQCVANRNVFRDCLKLFAPIIGFRKLSGREFQTDGPATQKARRPWELSWCLCVYLYVSLCHCSWCCVACKRLMWPTGNVAPSIDITHVLANRSSGSGRYAFLVTHSHCLCHGEVLSQFVVNYSSWNFWKDKPWGKKCDRSVVV